MADFSTLPKNASSDIKKWTLKVDTLKIRTMEILIQSAPVGPETYENTQTERNFGLKHKWLTEAKAQWVNDFKWEKQEEILNRMPQYKTKIIDDDGSEFELHFMALFSTKPDAVPIAFLHGWPGSFLEFVKLFDEFKQKYGNDPAKLPFHLIAPSLPGYAFSSGPPTHKNWDGADTARIINKLLVSIGFGSSGYIAQGGDIGSIVSQALATNHEECKAIHLNFRPGLPPKGDVDYSNLTQDEQAGMQKLKDWPEKDNSYAREHGTRPATIGLVLSSSPLALLAWIGEKFLEWTDKDPSTEEILQSVSLYWLTQTFPRSIYIYRDNKGASWEFEKPYGFSWFPKEILPVPKVWLEKRGNLIWFKRHESGGHFAAMEKPKELAEDVEAFVNQVWPTIKSNL